jgi:MFS family permease
VDGELGDAERCDDERMPPRRSLWMMYYLIFLTATNMVIIIPTAKQYAETLGAGEQFGGLLISLSPFFQCIIGIPVNFIMLKFGMSIKSIVILMAAGSVLGNVLYAFAGLMQSRWAILAARAITGLCQCQLAGPFYISKAVGIRNRTQVMFMFASCTALAFTLGPLLAGLLEDFVKDLHIENLVLDSDTVPGWFMALLYFFYMVKVFFLFEDPAAEASDSLGQAGSDDAPLLGAGLLVCFVCVFAAASANTMCEVFAIKLAQEAWSWSVSDSAYYMSAVMAVVTCMSFGSGYVTQFMQDRMGLLIWSLVGAVFAFFLFDYGYSSKMAYIVVFTTGLVAYQAAACIVRNYIYAMVSKLVPTRRKPLATAMSQSVLLLGRSVGSLLGALLTADGFGVVQVCLFLGVSFMTGLCFSKLTPHEKAT